MQKSDSIRTSMLLIAENKNLIASKDQAITKLKGIITVNDDALAKMAEEMARRVAIFTSTNKAQIIAIAERDVLLAAKDELISLGKASIKKSSEVIAEKDAMLERNETVINALSAQILAKDAIITQKNVTISENKLLIAEQDVLIAAKEQGHRKLQDIIAAKDAKLAAQAEDLTKREAVCTAMVAAISEKDAQIVKLCKGVVLKNIVITSLAADVEALQNNMAEFAHPADLLEQERRDSLQQAQLTASACRESDLQEQLYVAHQRTAQLEDMQQRQTGQLDGLVSDIARYKTHVQTLEGRMAEWKTSGPDAVAMRQSTEALTAERHLRMSEVERLGQAQAATLQAAKMDGAALVSLMETPATTEVNDLRAQLRDLLSSLAEKNFLCLQQQEELSRICEQARIFHGNVANAMLMREQVSVASHRQRQIATSAFVYEAGQESVMLLENQLATMSGMAAQLSTEREATTTLASQLMAIHNLSCNKGSRQGPSGP